MNTEGCEHTDAARHPFVQEHVRGHGSDRASVHKHAYMYVYIHIKSRHTVPRGLSGRNYSFVHH